MNQSFDHRAPLKSVSELGKFIRENRKSRQLTIATLSGLSNVSPKFLSELERGKETAEIGKTLDVIRALGLDLVIRNRSEPTRSARRPLR